MPSKYKVADEKTPSQRQQFKTRQIRAFWSIPTNILSFLARATEALILASTNPQYDKGLFIDLHVQNMKFPSSERGERT